MPDHDLIFTEGKINQFFWYFSDFQEIFRPETALNQLLGASTFLERIADSKVGDQLKFNQRTNNIHDFSVKLIKLSRSVIEEDKSQIYQPVIGFNGNLDMKKGNVEKRIRE